MKKELNPKLLGIFVLSGTALLLSIILAFASDRYFQTTEKFVLYFPGSLNGLQVGAPVKFRGVKVGTVNDITVELSYKNKEVSLPVHITIEADRMHEIDMPVHRKEHELINDFIQRGLRARLAMQSMVTGLLYVELDVFPDTPINLSKKDPKYFEVPTIPSKAEELSSIIDTAKTTLKRIKELAESKKIDQAIDDLASILQTGKYTMVDIQGAATNANGAFKEIKNIAGDVNNRTQPIVVKLEHALTEFKSTLASIKVLASYLARHPEALIRGKAPTKR